MKVPDVVILDCNLQRDAQRVVYEGMTRRLAEAGIRLLVDDHWSDDYAKAGLLIGADPLPDGDVLLDCRVLGQRTLNRLTRLEVAERSGAPVVPFGTPANDAELDALANRWGTDRAVLKYDWSARRNGVFLWPLDPSRRKPFPDDFKPACDVFMAFQDDDPRTYKVEACGGVVVGGYILLTRDMREPSWQKIENTEELAFEPPDELRGQLSAASKAFLREGAGYTSFDLMRTGARFQIVEVNTCGVGTALWNIWPERYVEKYSEAIVETLGLIETIPRYRDLRERAILSGNDAQAPVLPRRETVIAAGIDPETTSTLEEPTRTERTSIEVQFIRSLDTTDRLRPNKMAEVVRPPLEALLRQARDQVPFYSGRLGGLFRADGSVDWDAWLDVPVLQRVDIAQNRRELLARRLPPVHGASIQVHTPGTEREPMTVTRTGTMAGIGSCTEVRYFLWHGVPADAVMATIRREPPGLASGSRNWMPHWYPGEKGLEWEISSAAPVREQLLWLKERGPVWLRTRPSLLQQMALAIREDASLKPHLLGILTSEEILTDDQRRLAKEFLGHSPRDLYRLAEADIVAIQCPETSAYHIQAETVLVELLDDDGEPCAAGKAGRIVVTPLYSMAMPIIRYDTGDIAVADDDFANLKGSMCVCGRRLPRLRHILGRRRNRLTIPKLGERPPEISSVELSDLAGVRLWQLLQTAERKLTLRIDTEQPIAPDRAKAAADNVLGKLAGDYEVTVERTDLLTSAGERRFEPFLSQPV